MATAPVLIIRITTSTKLFVIRCRKYGRFMEEKKYAVLIDGDNVSYKYIDTILSEMTKYGLVTYKRIYCDFTSSRAGKWRQLVRDNGIQAMQQFDNTAGKNATDSALIIDAMDILYSGNVDGFCIVSSDSDFTRLAVRLKESGMDVIGMGESKTPRSFRAACTVFTDLELLLEAESEEAPVDRPRKKKAVKNNIAKISKIENVIIEIINENNNKGKKTELGEIGSRIQKKYNDFDVRQYGYSSLSKFIDETDSFVLSKENHVLYVMLKEDSDTKNKVLEYAKRCVKNAGRKGIELAALGQKIHIMYPAFKVKEYGYSTLQKFISGTNLFRIESHDDNKKFVFLKDGER